MDNVDKNQMRERWLTTYQTLSLLEDLHVWPVDVDIVDIEAQLLEELEEIEYQLGHSYQP
jgi:hypothetical protein